MPRKSASYNDFLSQQLREDPELALHYLNEAEQTNDPHALFVALRNVIMAQNGMSEMEERTGIKRQSLYKMLSGKGNPGWIGMVTVLHSLGFSIEFTMNQRTGKTRSKRASKPQPGAKPKPAKASSTAKKKAAN